MYIYIYIYNILLCFIVKYGFKYFIYLHVNRSNSYLIESKFWFY